MGAHFKWPVNTLFVYYQYTSHILLIHFKCLNNTFAMSSNILFMYCEYTLGARGIHFSYIANTLQVLNQYIFYVRQYAFYVLLIVFKRPVNMHMCSINILRVCYCIMFIFLRWIFLLHPTGYPYSRYKALQTSEESQTSKRQRLLNVS